MDRAVRLSLLLEEAQRLMHLYVEEDVPQRACSICGTDHFQPHEEWCRAGQTLDWLERVKAELG